MRLAGRLLSNLNLDNDRFSRATVQAATVWITSNARNLAEVERKERAVEHAQHNSLVLGDLIQNDDDY